MKKNIEKLQRRLVLFSKKNLGRPYKYGAKLREAPKFFDCSTFVQYIFKRIKIDLPRTALSQAHFGKKTSLEDLRVGDLIFTRGKWGHYNPEFPEGIGHVAIYIGEGKIIHARDKRGTKWRIKKGPTAGGVIQEPLNFFIKKQKVIAIKRILC